MALSDEEKAAERLVVQTAMAYVDAQGMTYPAAARQTIEDMIAANGSILTLLARSLTFQGLYHQVMQVHHQERYKIRRAIARELRQPIAELRKEEAIITGKRKAVWDMRFMVHKLQVLLPVRQMRRSHLAQMREYYYDMESVGERFGTFFRTLEARVQAAPDDLSVEDVMTEDDVEQVALASGILNVRDAQGGQPPEPEEPAA